MYHHQPTINQSYCTFSPGPVLVAYAFYWFYDAVFVTEEGYHQTILVPSYA